MGGVLRGGAAEELTAVAGINEELERSTLRIEQAGEAARAMSQTGERMAQLHIVDPHVVGLARSTITAPISRQSHANLALISR